MTCKKCSFEFSDDFAFCPKCGTKVEVKDEISLPGASEEIMEIEDSDSSIEDFEIENGILRKYKGKNKNIKIPDSVTEIRLCAFRHCSSLTSVSIPDSVIKIGPRAFDDCSSLSGISIPNSVTYIGNDAFFGCKIDNLEYRDLLKIKNGLALSDDETRVLYCANSSLTSVSIPDSVTEIGNDAFRVYSSLTSVSIPDSVTEIGEYAFDGCSSLTSVSIHDSVIEIGNDAFFGCKIDNLEYRDLLKIKNGLALSDDETRVLYCANSSLTSIYIPDSVTEIGNGAFASCSSLTSVSIPDSVTEIGEEAFYNCSSLTSVSIPDSVTEIGDGAFSSCSSLTSVFIPDSVTEIVCSAFRHCSSLTSVSIPDSVTKIGPRSFYDCSSLTSVSIPDSVTEIGNDAFYDCSNLTSVSIPNSVTEIGEFAFYGCKIDNLEYRDLLKIKNGLALSDDETRVLYCANSSLTSVSIPDSVTEIVEYAFAFCSSLTSVSIPNSVTEIGVFAFDDCTSLTEVIFKGTKKEWKKIKKIEDFGNDIKVKFEK